MEGDHQGLTLWDVANVHKYKTLSNWLFHSNRYRMVEDKHSRSYKYFSSDLQRLEKDGICKAENESQLHKSTVWNNDEIMFQTLEKFDRRVTKDEIMRHKGRKMQ